MNKTGSFEGLKAFLPEGSFYRVMDYIYHYKVHLTITQNRRTKLGDFSHKSSNYGNHRISVNGNLNKYAFLITLIHELAHLIAFEAYGQHIQPHGREWKSTYSQMLKQFADLHIFPEEILRPLRLLIHKPSATTAGEVPLQRALKKFDPPSQLIALEQLPINALFGIAGGRTFAKGPLIRKRYQCMELKSKQMYLFQPLAEVKLLKMPNVQKDA